MGITGRKKNSCQPPGSGELSFSKYFRAAAGIAGGRSSRNKNDCYPVLKKSSLFCDYQVSAGDTEYSFLLHGGYDSGIETFG